MSAQNFFLGAQPPDEKSDGHCFLADMDRLAGEPLHQL
jgi:hypothetical protein